MTGLVGSVEATVELLNQETGIPFVRIPGYEGTSDALLGVLSGEIAGTQYGTPGYVTSIIPHVETGDIIPLLSTGLLDADGNIIRHPAIPDIPTAAEVFELTGHPMEGLGWEAYKAIAPVSGP